MRSVIIAGSPEYDIHFIRQTVRHGDLVICADLGLHHALKAQVPVDIAIGDFDSFEGDLPEALPSVRLKCEKAYSDTHEAAKLALARGADEIVILCALGARLDHTLSNLSTLSFLARRGVRAEIASAGERVRMLTEGVHRFDNLSGKTFSLFPFGCESVTLSIQGAKYPLHRGVLYSHEPLGLSNIFTADTALVTVHQGQAAAIINEK